MATIDREDFSDWAALLTLLRRAYAGMAGQIDPPSSLDSMTADMLRDKARREDLLLICEAGVAIACLFAAPRGDALYIGKLAVDPDHQGKGLARRLLYAAETLARRRALSALTLQTRIELRENHRAFRAMGFRLVGATRHPGHSRATSLMFRRDLSPLPLPPARAMS